MRLKNKVAIVTGASRSIGASVAACYAREGAKVVVNYRSHAELAEQVVQAIREQGGEAFACCADVSEEADVNAMVAETVRRYGTVDILVNNAAIDPRQSWETLSVADWDRVMAVNVRSQFLCAQAVFPCMKAQRYGKIINVSSVTFFTGQRGYVHYVASKGAIVGFTRALAREIGEHGISVNCITPGAIRTETEAEKVSPSATAEALEKRMAELQAVPRRGIAGDLEGAFLLFASEASDFITGQTLNVDGGWVMH